MRRLERPEAVAEFDAAVDWYSERSGRIASEFVDVVESTIAQIVRWPLSGHPYGGREDRIPLVRTLSVRGFPYSIVYVVEDDAVVILAYSHDRQRPGYWRHRLDLA